MAGDVIMVLVILTEEDWDEAIEHVLRRCSILLIPLSVVYIRYFSQIGISYTYDGMRTWTGVTTHKNTLGVLCAITGIFLLWRIFKRWPKGIAIDGLLFLLTLYLLRGARSSTSAIIFFLGVMLLTVGYFIKNNVKLLTRVVRLTLLLVVSLQLLSVSFFNKSIESTFFSLAGRDSTFTGRVPLWQEVIKIGSRQPILGAGYGSFWITNLRQIWAKFNFHPNNAHNGYIDAFLDLGILGVVALLLLIIRAYKNTLKLYQENAKLGNLILTFLVMILAHNFTESSLAKGFNLLWFLLLIPSIVVSQKPDSQETRLPAGMAATS